MEIISLICIAGIVLTLFIAAATSLKSRRFYFLGAVTCFILTGIFIWSTSHIREVLPSDLTLAVIFLIGGLALLAFSSKKIYEEAERADQEKKIGTN